MGKVREYEGNEITILYDAARCYHAEECIHGAPGVFRKDARPWVSPDGEDAGRTADVIRRCPTGALHYRVKNEALNEKPDAENTVTVTANGPLVARGDMEINLPDSALREVRAAFCRCGASANKPFCDDSHYRIGFTDPGPASSNSVTDIAPGGILTVTPAPNGPLLANGSVTIRSAAGLTSAVVTKTAFCRCGASGNKPFCDGSHQRIGFIG